MSSNQKPATLDDVVAALQKNQETLEEIKMWAKVNGVEKVQSLLNKALNTPEKRIMYHLSDGKSIRDIIAICGGSTATVSSCWNKLGLMKSINVKRGERFIKAFDLEHYGIEIPSMPKKETPTIVEQKEVESNTEGEEQNGQE